MRFIVDIFRILILAGVALVLIAISFVVISVLMVGMPPALGGATALAGIGFLIILVLSLGMLATIISAHDRLAALSDHVARVAEAMETKNGNPNQDQS
jgi:hypothetical protein